MSIVRVSLFGKFRIEADTNSIQKFEPQKAKELFVYLLLNRDQPQSREHLADVLWGEISQDQASNYLRKALWQLQSNLENLDKGKQEVVRVDGEYLQINPQCELWLDISEFEEAFRVTQGILGRDLDESQAQTLENAVAVYRGELLDDWYQDWCLYERERLQHLYLSMLDKLMDYSEVHGAYEDGMIFGKRILQYDRARERTHRRLMRLYYLAGDRTSALRQFQKCTLILKEELDVKPATSTWRVYEQIRTDQLESLSPIEKTRIRKSQEDPLRKVFDHLQVLHKELSQMQKQVMQDMRVIQKTIKED